MWIYTSRGLLLPTRTAPNVHPKLSKCGALDLQVAARTTGILLDFCRQYMPPGTFTPVFSDPQDGWRFFTTRAAFAAAIGQAVMAVDYSRFDPSVYSPEPYLLDEEQFEEPETTLQEKCLPGD